MRRVNPERKAREFARAFCSRARVAFIKTLPCVVPYCRSAQIENMHIAGGGSGRKADAHLIVPCCTAHHAQVHQQGILSFMRAHALGPLHLQHAAAATEVAWRADSGEYDL